VNAPAVGGGARVKVKSQSVEMSSTVPLDHTDGDLDRDRRNTDRYAIGACELPASHPVQMLY